MCFGLAVASSVDAQGIRGRVVLPDSATPAVGRQAGKKPVTLVGAVTDDAGRPLRSAIVQTEKAARRAALTDTLGGFRIPLLPSGEVVVSVRCAGFQSVRFALPLIADSIRDISLALRPIDTRSTPARSCSDP